jgi:hypothetical protein
VRFSKRPLLLGAIVLAVVGSVGALMTTPEPARARKGYGGGGYGYKPCNTACHVAKCRKACGKTKRTCVFCVRKDKQAGGATCAQTAQQSLASCAGGDKACKTGARKALKTCKAQVKERYKQAKGNCGGLTGSCRGCCGENYQGACGGVFRGTDGYGTSFRTYGNKNYRPDCTVTGDAQPGDPQCQAVCERLYSRALALCGGGKRSAPVPAATAGDPECVARAEADRIACLARCGITPSTTTTFPFGSSTSTIFGQPLPTSTTSTTTSPPASPRGAFLD